MSSCAITGKIPCECTLKDKLRKVFSEHAAYTERLVEAHLRAPAQPSLVVALVARLDRNHEDIGDLVKPLMGDRGVARLMPLLHARVLATASAVDALKSGDDRAIKKTGAALLASGDRVAKLLGSIAAVQLEGSRGGEGCRDHTVETAWSQAAKSSQSGEADSTPATSPRPDSAAKVSSSSEDEAKDACRQHDASIVNLTRLHLADKHACAIDAYDAYYTRMLALSDAIASRAPSANPQVCEERSDSGVREEPIGAE
jgi:hypothetical protein